MANEQVTNLIDIVATCHDRWLAMSVGAILTQSTCRHQAVAQARRTFGRRDGATLADVGLNRFGRAAIARRTVGRAIRLA